MDVLLFGDQTGLSYDFLNSALQRTQNSATVNAFLSQAAKVLRQEVSQLPQVEREGIPNFTTIDELVQSCSQDFSGHPAIESFLLCLSQFTHFLGHHEGHGSRAYPPTESRVLGLCLGSLTGAAIASSTSTSDLVPLAAEVVGIAFRVGLQAFRTARHLQSRVKVTDSWSIVYTGMDELYVRVALEDFNRDLEVPKPNSPYISAVGPNAITISGPPLILKKLQETSTALTKGHGLNLPIHSPFHAPELFGEVDFRQLVLGRDNAAEETISRYNAHPTLVSSTNGEPSFATKAVDLLEQIVREILTEPLRWDKVLAGLSASTFVDTSETSVQVFGASNATASLVSALKAEGRQISLQDTSSWLSSPLASGFGAAGGFRGSRLAIVGLSGRFPGGSSHEEFWDTLEKGLDLHKEIPSDRFDIKSHVDPDGKKRNTSHTPYGCFIDNPGHFDPKFFNMSPREAAQTCPMQRLALVTAYEALEASGYVPNRTASTTLDRTGTFYGQTSDDYREINAGQDVDTYFITGGIRAFGPGRINYHFKFSGPSFSVDTACSSSLSAIQLACTSLWSGDCDMAVAGGLNVMTSPDLFAGLSRGQFLSKTGACKTFDDAADGYCRGDAVGTVILKRLDDAILDNDKVLGVILGAATNHSANAISITHPHAKTQENLYRKVLLQSGVNALDVDYVEMHGTGTQAGDGAEMKSISDVFAPAVAGRSRENPLYVGSVKANAGHGEAASGVTALIKSLLMLQKNTIPPHCGIKGQINQKFPDLDERNIRIALTKTPFKARVSGKRRLLVNNFSAAGGNTALLLEEYVSKNDATSDFRSGHPVVISAKSIHSLTENTKGLRSYLDQNPYTTLASLSYTTTARRVHQAYRIAITASSILQVKEKLEEELQVISKVTPISASKVAFAYTGQGAYYSTLGRELYSTSNHFRSQLALYDAFAQSHGFSSILPLVEQPTDTQEIPPVTLQVFLVSIQMALTSLWATWGIVPEVVVGHSLGEYAALNAAGVLSASDTIFLVGHRARLLQTKCTAGTHIMLAIRGQAPSIRAIINEKGWTLEIACINGPNDVVLSGESGQVEHANQELSRLGYKCTRLNVPFAFHSSQVEPILTSFESIGHSVTFHEPRIPIISPLIGEVIAQDEVISPGYLCRHARETVDFEAATRAASQHGLIDESTGWVEIGPHPVCLRMINTISTSRFSVPSLRRDEDAWKTIANGVKELYTTGARLDWTEYHRDQVRSVELLSLPAYSFENKNYWIDYRNQWSLIKGRVDGDEVVEERKKFSTTSLQRIVSEDFEEERATVIFESDFADPDLHAAVVGHLVNDSGLCPSSIYADMALSAANYIHQQLVPAEPSPGMNVKAMKVTKPVIVSVSKPKEHRLQITAKVDLILRTADIEYSSINSQDNSKTLNANCQIEYGDVADWSALWARNAYLIDSRIKALERGARDGDVQRILRGMVYKLFASLVQYGDKYRGMEEVLLQSGQCEAVAKVKFQTGTDPGNFFMSPYWIDSLAHLSGFILNANDAVDSKNQVYISHGWESMRFNTPFSVEKTYRTYVRMQAETASTVMAGDVYVLDGDVIVGLVEGLKFQRVPRTLLNHLLPPGGQKGGHSDTVSVRTKPIVKTTPVQIVEKVKPASSKRPSIVQIEDIRAVTVAQAPSIADRIGDIIADEIGVAAQELSESSVFSELGIDSLLSLTITGKLREEFDISVSSSLFLDYHTLGALRQHLRQHDVKVAVPPPSRKVSIAQPVVLDDIEDNTPELVVSGDVSSASETESSNTGHESNVSSVMRTIVADEMGIDVEELSTATPLGSLGMDSLMKLTILGVLREKTGLEIPQSLLDDDPTIQDIEKKLAPPPATIVERVAVVKVAPSIISERVASVKTAPSIISTTKKTTKSPINISAPVVASIQAPIPPLITNPDPFTSYYPPATSILLQGSPQTSSSTLFLFPDGSGSATSYTSLPLLSPSNNLSVYGLNSPFIRSPRDYTCGIQGIAQLYIAEMQRRQPHGPYSLGGWSVGGVIAYEAVYQLLAKGKAVQDLVLIDAPCPLLLPPLPVSLVRFFDSIGLFGGNSNINGGSGSGSGGSGSGSGSASDDGESTPSRKTPTWLLEHFDSSVANLHRYKPLPLSSLPPSRTGESSPQVGTTTALWAREGVCGAASGCAVRPGLGVEESRSKSWILEDRVDFGANGWDELVGMGENAGGSGKGVEGVGVPGNHFSMMRGENVLQLGQQIRYALGRSG